MICCLVQRILGRACREQDKILAQTLRPSRMELKRSKIDYQISVSCCLELLRLCIWMQHTQITVQQDHWAMSLKKNVFYVKHTGLA